VDSYRNVTIYEATTDPTVLHIAVLPEGKDPDQLVRDDPKAWQGVVAEALPLLDYLLASASDRWDLAGSEGKRAAAEALNEVIASVANPFEQERFRRKLADVLEVSLATLEASIGRSQRPASRRGGSRGTQEASLTPFEMESHDSLEEHLLALLLQWPELREHATDLDIQVLEKWENREAFTYWTECSTIEQLQQAPDENLRQRIGYLQTLPIPPMDLRHRQQAVKDCIRRLKERHLRNLKVEEALLLDQSGQSKDMEQQVVDTNEKLKQLFLEKSSYQH
jgi:DNA primase